MFRLSPLPFAARLFARRVASPAAAGAALPRPRWWQWPTILSLDAPVVALVWQWQLMRLAHASPRGPHLFVLGASTWLAYAADRWFEGWWLEPGRIRTQRHRFYQRWRWPVASCWLALLAADVAVATLGLTRREFAAGLVLLAPVLLYVLSHQLVHRDARWRAPKELCVALLVSGGAGVFAAAQPAAPWRALAEPIGLLFLLCFSNCALISVWEHEVDEAHGQTSLARQSRHVRHFSRALPWLLAVAAALLAAASAAPDRAVAWCAAASAGLLGLLDLLQPRLGRRRARALVDATLLTPLVSLLLR